MTPKEELIRRIELLEQAKSLIKNSIAKLDITRKIKKLRMEVNSAK